VLVIKIVLDATFHLEEDDDDVMMKGGNMPRVVTVLRFHFRFGFGSVLHRKPRFRFFPVSVLREIWVKQIINCKRNNFMREPHQLRRI